MVVIDFGILYGRGVEEEDLLIGCGEQRIEFLVGNKDKEVGWFGRLKERARAITRVSWARGMEVEGRVCDC